MNCEIIAIGSELLTPHRSDTNSLFLTERLNKIGVQVAFKSIVGDRKQDLVEQVRIALSRADVVITMGGLGPTVDDLTREAVWSIDPPGVAAVDRTGLVTPLKEGKATLRAILQRMETRTLHVTETPLEPEPAEEGGAAGGLHGELDRLDRTARDECAMLEDHVAGRRPGLRDFAVRHHAVERDARRRDGRTFDGGRLGYGRRHRPHV